MAATTDQAPPVVKAPELDAGTRLGDRYRLVARLGRGGGGAVWRAFDEKVGEEVALKIIDSGADLERWRREVALARRISHPNVCRVYDLGEAGGRRWVTMERIEGESLRALLVRGDVPKANVVMRQIVDAVAAIHAAGVVHRDLKPENIVVDRDGRAVVVDFGLAKVPGSEEPTSESVPPSSPNVTQQGAVLGTPRYMAPEQAAGQVADARSDVFALGLVLHEIATCGQPAANADAMATTVSDAALQRSQPGLALSSLPRPWGPIVSRCASLRAEDRYADAIAVRAALDAPRVRRRRMIAVAAGVVLLGGASAAVMLSAGDDARPPVAKPLVVRRLTTTSSDPETQPLSIALSPDGKTMAYTVGASLFTRDVDGAAAMRANMPTTAGGFPVARLAFAVGFTPDDRALVQVLERDDTWSVWAVGGTKPPARVAFAGPSRMNLALSPTGDRLAMATRDSGLAIVPIRGGAPHVVVGAKPGETIGGPSWSPDGTRLAFVRYAADGSGDSLEVCDVADGALPRVLTRAAFANPVDQLTAWTSSDRIVYAVNAPDGTGSIMAVKLAGKVAAGPPVEIERWPGEYVGVGSLAAGRLAFMRGTAAYAIEVGNLDRQGYIFNLARAHPESVQARRLAGWAPDGRLVHAVNGTVVARAPRGEAAVLVDFTDDAMPDTLADGAVLYHRGTSVRRVDVATGDIGTLGDVASLRNAANVVRCAGDRAPPCVIEEVRGADVRYLRFDPVTGARGDEVYKTSLGGRYMRSVAVSPDGNALALVDGTNQLTYVDLRDGKVTNDVFPPSAELQSVSWSRDGATVLVTAIGGADDLFNVMRVTPGGGRELLLHSNRRWFWRVQESPTGDAVAVQTRELVLDIWLVDGL